MTQPEPEPTPEPPSELGPVDLPGPSLDDDEGDGDLGGVSLYTVRRRVGRFLGVSIALAASVGVLELCAGFDLDRVEDVHHDCASDVWSGDLDRCRIPRGVLAWWWPTTREDWLRTHAEVDYEIEKDRLVRATRLDFDAVAEAEIIEDLIADRRELDAQNRGRDTPLLSVLAEHGAHAKLLELADAGWVTNAHDYELVEHGAILLGQPERALESWGRAKPEDFAHLWGFEGAAWLCLHDPARGMEALWAVEVAAVSLTARETKQSDARERARARQRRRVAQVACGAEVDVVKVVRYPDGAAWLAARDAARGARPASAWLDHSANRSNEARAQVIAQAVLREHPDQASVLRWLMTDGVRIEDALLDFSPSLQRAGHGRIVTRRGARVANTYDPASMAAAAERLAKLAELASQTASRRGERPPGMHPAAWADPAATLRRGAAVLADEAADEWIARGELEQAHAISSRARAWHDPSHEWIAVGLALQAGDSEGALAWISARRAALEGHPLCAQVERTHLAELELRALAGLGRWSEAHERAMVRLAECSARELSGDHALLLQTWVLALSARLGEPLPLFTWEDPRYDDHAWQGGWLERLVQPARDPAQARRSRARRGHYPMAPDYPDLSAMLLAAHAHAPAHEERWLDAELHWDEKLGREQLWARAEVARWRGDDEAEERWRERLARVLALANTEDRALLLHVAGI